MDLLIERIVFLFLFRSQEGCVPRWIYENVSAMGFESRTPNYFTYTSGISIFISCTFLLGQKAQNILSDELVFENVSVESYISFVLIIKTIKSRVAKINNKSSSKTSSSQIGKSTSTWSYLLVDLDSKFTLLIHSQPVSTTVQNFKMNLACRAPHIKKLSKFDLIAENRNTCFVTRVIVFV